jgi:bacterioferritin-associated ferredoxin
MYICLCKGINDSKIRELVLAGISSPDTLAQTLGLDEDGVCGQCLQHIEALMARATREATLREQSTRRGKPDNS